MAVFLINSCKFNGCGLTFKTLSDLILHIEDTHIDADPNVIEKQERQPPASLALSYVCRLFTGSSRKDFIHPRPSSVSSVSSVRSITPTASEIEDREIQCDGNNSDDSWTTQEELSSDFILKMVASTEKDSEAEKPFVCPVPGCTKRYKNINGMKYHAKHGHKSDVKIKKSFKCKCGKSYKSAVGLHHHASVHHGSGQHAYLKAIPDSLVQKTVMKAAVPTIQLLHQVGSHVKKMTKKDASSTVCLGNPCTVSTEMLSKSNLHIQTQMNSLAASLPHAILAQASGSSNSVTLATIAKPGRSDGSVVTVPVNVSGVPPSALANMTHLSNVMTLPVTQVVFNNGITMATHGDRLFSASPAQDTKSLQPTLRIVQTKTPMSVSAMATTSSNIGPSSSPAIVHPVTKFIPSKPLEMLDIPVTMDSAISNFEDFSMATDEQSESALSSSLNSIADIEGDSDSEACIDVTDDEKNHCLGTGKAPLNFPFWDRAEKMIPIVDSPVMGEDVMVGSDRCME